MSLQALLGIIDMTATITLYKLAAHILLLSWPHLPQHYLFYSLLQIAEISHRYFVYR